MPFRTCMPVLALALVAGCNDSRPTAEVALSVPPDVSPDINELFQQTQGLLDRGKGDEAVDLAEKAVRSNPQDPYLQLLWAQVTQWQGAELAATNREAANGYFHKSADALRQYRQLQPTLSDREQQFLALAFYRDARSYALENQSSRAIAALRESLQAGFAEPDGLTSDPALESLRSVPEFQQLVAEAQAEIQKRLSEETRRELAEFRPFSFDFTLSDFAGRTVSRQDYQGKVLIVDFWGTWCPPCLEEIPRLVRLHEKYRSDGLEIVGINYEDGSPEEVKQTIAAFVKQHGVTYPCLIGDNQTQDRANVEAYPTMFFVDRHGRVRMKLLGNHPYEKLEAVVLELLGRESGAA